MNAFVTFYLLLGVLVFIHVTLPLLQQREKAQPATGLTIIVGTCQALWTVLLTVVVTLGSLYILILWSTFDSGPITGKKIQSLLQWAARWQQIFSGIGRAWTYLVVFIACIVLIWISVAERRRYRHIDPEFITLLSDGERITGIWFNAKQVRRGRLMWMIAGRSFFRTINRVGRTLAAITLAILVLSLVVGNANTVATGFTIAALELELRRIETLDRSIFELEKHKSQATPSTDFSASVPLTSEEEAGIRYASNAIANAILSDDWQWRSNDVDLSRFGGKYYNSPEAQKRKPVSIPATPEAGTATVEDFGSGLHEIIMKQLRKFATLSPKFREYIRGFSLEATPSEVSETFAGNLVSAVSYNSIQPMLEHLFSDSLLGSILARTFKGSVTKLVARYIDTKIKLFVVAGVRKLSPEDAINQVTSNHRDPHLSPTDYATLLSDINAEADRIEQQRRDKSRAPTVPISLQNLELWYPGKPLPEKWCKCLYRSSQPKPTSCSDSRCTYIK